MKKTFEPDLDVFMSRKSAASACIGAALQKIRISRGFSVERLSSKMHIDASEILRIEQGCDVQISVINDYISFMDGFLQISATFGSAVHAINIFDKAPQSVSALDDEQLLLPIIGDEAVKNNRDVVFSIKPEYSEKIMAGEKTVELRRRFPTNIAQGTNALIYSTSPTRALIGSVKIERVIKEATGKIWELFSDVSCIGKEKFDDYFSGVDDGFAIQLEDPQPLPRKLGLSELRERFNFEPPQSYFYASQKMKDALVREFG